MDRVIEAEVQSSADTTREALADLTTYDKWLPLVSAVEANDDGSWLVTLKARLGPLARSKRLRMVRSDDSDHEISFVRAETDGRDHATWELNADVESTGDATCTATVRLHYSGSLWSAPIEAALASAEGAAVTRLNDYLHE